VVKLSIYDGTVMTPIRQLHDATRDSVPAHIAASAAGMG
jgi:hypothetical protein